MTTTAGDVEPARMAPEALVTYVRDRLEDRLLDDLVAHGQVTLTVAPAALPIAVQLCRDDPTLGFDFFDFLTAVDEREEGFAVVVHLYSTRHRHHIQIRALAEGGRDAPTLPTISHLFAGANWHERETYDMFGITFDGHPGLLPRILTVENFEGFPLRKEFLLMTREVKPWPGLKEPKEADDDEAEEGGGTTASGPSAEEKARMARERAERAKAKAAEARKRRARERASASEPEGGDLKDTAAAPPDEVTPTFQGEDGGVGLPPRGTGEEEPRALAGDGVDAVPLADEDAASVGETTADRPELDRPVGTDADDRLRDLEDDQEGQA